MMVIAKPDMSNQSTQAEQRVEKETEIKDEPKKSLKTRKYQRLLIGSLLHMNTMRSMML